MLREAYEAVSPDGPEHFPTVFDKLAHTWKTEPSHELAELERVSAPTLVILGDDDVLTIDHAAAIQRAIPDSPSSPWCRAPTTCWCSRSRRW